MQRVLCANTVRVHTNTPGRIEPWTVLSTHPLFRFVNFFIKNSTCSISNFFCLDFVLNMVANMMKMNSQHDVQDSTCFNWICCASTVARSHSGTNTQTKDSGKRHQDLRNGRNTFGQHETVRRSTKFSGQAGNNVVRHGHHHQGSSGQQCHRQSDQHDPGWVPPAQCWQQLVNMVDHAHRRGIHQLAANNTRDQQDAGNNSRSTQNAGVWQSAVCDITSDGNSNDDLPPDGIPHSEPEVNMDPDGIPTGFSTRDAEECQQRHKPVARGFNNPQLQVEYNKVLRFNTFELASPKCGPWPQRTNSHSWTPSTNRWAGSATWFGHSTCQVSWHRWTQWRTACGRQWSKLWATAGAKLSTVSPRRSTRSWSWCFNRCTHLGKRTTWWTAAPSHIMGPRPWREYEEAHSWWNGSTRWRRTCTTTTSSPPTSTGCDTWQAMWSLMMTTRMTTWTSRQATTQIWRAEMATMPHHGGSSDLQVPKGTKR